MIVQEKVEFYIIDLGTITASLNKLNKTLKA